VKRSGGFSLAEVLVAVLILAIGALPLFTVSSGAREEAADAAAFLALADRLDEKLVGEARATVDEAITVSVTEGPRALSQAVRPGDRYASFAPATAVSGNAAAGGSAEVLP
jgi:prepilin-type N-terminal cleavage/methylation domain-containing protein